jgi:flagellar assembly protein FliH
MILLSRVIKYFFTNNSAQVEKTIALKKVDQDQQAVDQIADHEREFNNGLTAAEKNEQELQRALEEADIIRKEANEEYEQLQGKMNEEILASQKYAEEIYKQAEENGYNEGFQHGLQEGQKQYEALINDAKNVVEASKTDHFERLEEAETVIVELALKVAEKIVAEKITDQPDYWISLVKEVINEVREEEQVKLYIHPSWYEVTLAHKEELRLLLPNCQSLYIYPDIHLEENGCTIETRYGKINASVDSQLTEIKDALLEKLKEMDGYEGS